MEGTDPMTKKNEYDKWDIESAARTLIEVEEIKKNEKLYTLAKVELKKQADAALAAAKQAGIETKTSKKLKDAFKD